MFIKVAHIAKTLNNEATKGIVTLKTKWPFSELYSININLIINNYPFYNSIRLGNTYPIYTVIYRLDKSVRKPLTYCGLSFSGNWASIASSTFHQTCSKKLLSKDGCKFNNICLV